MSLDPRTRGIVEEALAYTFKDPALIEQALTHRSLFAERKAKASNEALEFLGDAVLSLVIAEMLHRRDPFGAEGEKTRIRARLVSTPTLVGVARSFNLASLIMMSVAEEGAGGRLRDRAQEDALEALLAAVYVDGGIHAAQKVVSRLFGPILDRGPLSSKDAKSSLQEFLQQSGAELPVYQVERGGLEHQHWWRCICLVHGEPLGRGEGPSRKKAELAAAQEALDALKSRSMS